MGHQFCKSYSNPLAFYVWTDTLILNAVKIKEAYFSDQTADMFILDLQRVSHELVACVEEKRVFRKIVWISRPYETANALVRKTVRTLLGRLYTARFFEQIRPVDHYDALFTGALWSESLSLFQCLRKQNPGIDIHIMEEGTANYHGVGLISRCDPLGKLRSEILRITRYLTVYGAARKAMKTMFLSCPEACLDAGGLTVLPICGHEEGAFRQIVSQCAEGVRLDAYRERPVILFLQPEKADEHTKTMEIIRAVIRAAGAERVVVRPHPDDRGLVQSLREEFGEEAYIETQRFPFEYALHSADWDKKILISRGSSCLFFPRYVLKSSPALIFTEYLYDRNEKRKYTISPLAEKLRCFYGDPTVLHQPESLRELEEILSQKTVF